MKRWWISIALLLASLMIRAETPPQTRTDAVALGDALASLRADSGLDELARDRLTVDLLLSLAPLRVNAQTRSLVADLVTEQPRHHVWLLEGYHRSKVPIYDVGAAARFAQRQWLRSDTRDQALASLARGEILDFSRWQAPDGQDGPGSAESIHDQRTQRDGIRDALLAASQESIFLHRDAAMGALLQHPRSGMFAAVIADRLDDDALYAAVLDHADHQTALAVLTGLPGKTDPGRLLPLLQRASHRQDLASAAILQMGRLAKTRSDAQAWLIDRLDDPLSGGSAAAALASLNDPGIALKLGRILNAPAPERTARRALLALRLDESDAAKREIEKFMARPGAHENLRIKAATWQQ